MHQNFEIRLRRTSVKPEADFCSQAQCSSTSYFSWSLLLWTGAVLKSTFVCQKHNFIDKRSTPVYSASLDACFCRQARYSSRLMRFRIMPLSTAAVLTFIWPLLELVMVHRHGTQAQVCPSEHISSTGYNMFSSTTGCACATVAANVD